MALPNFLLNMVKKPVKAVIANPGKSALAALLGLGAMPRGSTNTQTTETGDTYSSQGMNQPVAPNQTPYRAPGTFMNSDQQTPSMYTPVPPQQPMAQPGQTATMPSTAGYSAPVNGTNQPATTTTDTAAPAYNPQQELDRLRAKQMVDRATGQGAYAIDPKAGYSPDQVKSIQNAADDVYAERLGQFAYDANKTNSDPYSSLNGKLSQSSPYLQAAANAGIIPGKTGAAQVATINRIMVMPEDQQKATIRAAVYNSLSTGQQQKFADGDATTAAVKSLVESTPADFKTNPYKYQAQKFSAFLGSQGDPAYQNYQAIVGRITAPIINNIYGAAVTGGELDRAKQFIPNLSTDSTQAAMIKLQNLAAFSEFANDAQTALVLGLPRPDLSDYLKDHNVSGAGAGSSGGGVISTKNATFTQDANGNWVVKR